MDVFGDASVYVVHAPGHLPGHINLLVRVDADANNNGNGDGESGRWVYLAGDAAHDRRLLRGEVGIAEWDIEGGGKGCIHFDKEAAEETLERIRGLERVEVEIVLAHDWEWEEREVAKGERGFFGKAA
ncbi:hypothetical protein MMC10_003686 [Thelotrema lepadinum]|nr:hypothetical protein [Thelotrema lepadinum]